jgi:hypothetical protein
MVTSISVRYDVGLRVTSLSENTEPQVAVSHDKQWVVCQAHFRIPKITSHSN